MNTINYKNYKINIVDDNDSESPRDWDNLGTMVCFHNRYTLGDKSNLTKDMFENWNELHKFLKTHGAIIILPVYLYDHSGITISCSDNYPYNDRWDSMQVGFIYANRDAILKEFNCKNITSKIKDKATHILKSEINTYDMYLRGEVYGFKILDSQDNEIDSCYGFYGNNDLLIEAKSTIDYLIKNKTKSHIIKLKQWIINKVSLDYRLPLKLV